MLRMCVCDGGRISFEEKMEVVHQFMFENESTNSAKPSSLLNNRYTREVTHPTFHRTRVEKWTRPRGPASTHARR